MRDSELLQSVFAKLVADASGVLRSPNVAEEPMGFKQMGGPMERAAFKVVLKAFSRLF